MSNPWLLIILAGLLETTWALGLKYSDGFTKLIPTAFTLITAAGSFWLLSLAMKALPVGTAYAVWVGIGMLGTTIAAAILLGEPLTALRIAGIVMIIAGIAALKLA